MRDYAVKIQYTFQQQAKKTSIHVFIFKTGKKTISFLMLGRNKITNDAIASLLLSILLNALAFKLYQKRCKLNFERRTLNENHAFIYVTEDKKTLCC